MPSSGPRTFKGDSIEQALLAAIADGAYISDIVKPKMVIAGSQFSQPSNPDDEFDLDKAFADYMPQSDGSLPLRNPDESLHDETLRYMMEHRARVITTLRQNQLPLSKESSQVFYVQLQRLPEGAKIFEGIVKELRESRQKDAEALFAGQLEKVRGLIGGEFIDKLRTHYDELEKEIMKLVEGIEKHGTHYLMKDDDVNENFTADVEKVLDKMIAGFDELSQKQLNPISPEYASIKAISHEEIKKKFGNQYDRDPERGDYELECLKMNEIDELLEKGASPEDIKMRILDLVKKSLHHMRDTLAAGTRTILQRVPAKISKAHAGKQRMVDIKYEGSPLMKLEYLLGTTVRSIRSLMNINFQRSYLMSREMAAKKDISAVS